MNPSRDKIAFWSLLAVQAAGANAILWKGIPVYRRLLSPGPQDTDSGTFLLVFGAIVLMQVGYWLAFRLRPRLRFQKNVFAGHVFLCLGELSFIFASALATVILFEHFEEVVLVPWKLIVLAAILFAVFCYKYQLEVVGEQLMRGEPDQTSEAD